MKFKKPDITENDLRYARYIYNRLKREYGKRLTTMQVSKEMHKDTYATSQYLNQHGVHQMEKGYYYLDDVVPCMTLWRHNKLRRQQKEA